MDRRRGAWVFSVSGLRPAEDVRVRVSSDCTIEEHWGAGTVGGGCGWWVLWMAGGETVRGWGGEGVRNVERRAFGWW